MKPTHLVIASLVLFAGPAVVADLNVEVTGRARDDSIVTCCLYADDEGFPKDCVGTARQAAGVTGPGNRVRCTFPDIKAGSYAVAASEDLNRNGKLDTTWVGFPVEPWGVSNDVPARTFGPPEFSAAQVRVEDGTPVVVKLHE